jgi:Deacetylase PdaC
MIRYCLSAALLFFAISPPIAAQSLASGRIIEKKTDDYEFSFGYPAEAVTIPKLKSLFEKEIKKEQAQLIKSAIEAKADSAKNDYPYFAYQSGTAWEVAGSTGQLLSLSGFFSSYTGGAHGNYGFGARMWDKKAKRLLKNSFDVFANPKTALALLRQDYCASLNKERKEKLGAEWTADEDSVFGKCPEFSELAIVFNGDKGKPIDRIAFIAGPYVAGSYAEGQYEVELPVTAKLVEAVKSQYRASFAVK